MRYPESIIPYQDTLSAGVNNVCQGSFPTNRTNLNNVCQGSFPTNRTNLKKTRTASQQGGQSIDDINILY